MSTFPQDLFIKKYKNCFKILFAPCFKKSLGHKKSRTSKNKDILNAVPTYWITKMEDFEHWTFSAQNSTTKKSLVNLVSFFNKNAFFSSHVVLFALYYSDLVMYQWKLSFSTECWLYRWAWGLWVFFLKN